MSVKIQIKRANASAWTAANPTLAAGEWGMELDTKKLKLGTGALWNSTDYYSETLTLNSVGDVTITSLQNGDFLRYSSSASAWINDPVNLSTDTVGDYVQSLTAGTGVTLSNNSGEGATPTVAIGQAVGTSASVTFGQLTVNGQTNVGGNIIPNTNEAYDLGSASARFRDIYLSGTTINLGGAEITSDGTDISFSGAIGVSGSANFVGDLTGNADTATTLETSRAISLAGDLSGSASFDGSTNVTITATVQPNSVALGTDTTGNYVNDVVSGTGVTVTHAPGEGSSASIAIGQDVATSASVQFAKVTAPLDGNASTASTLQTPRTIALTGDVSGSVSFNGASDVSISATVQPNSVSLGTDTTGNYVNDVTAGTGVTVTHTPGEGSSPTIAIGQAVATSSSVQFAAVTAPLVGNVTGNADTATALQTARVIALSGDVSGSVSFNGTGNVDISTTIGANSVSLGSDTSGDYVSSLVAGTGVSLANNSGETATPTISIGQDVVTSASVTFAKVDTTGDVTVGGNLTVNGTTTTLNTETLSVEDNIVVLNSNATGSPALNAGLEVERGDSANVVLRWNESTDKWETTNDGSAYSVIATNGNIALGTDTTGNYMSGVSASTGVTIEHTPAEGSSATISIGQSVAPSASVTFAAVSAPLIGNVTGDVSGNSGTATALQNSRVISIGGDVSGSVSFNGTSDVTISAAIQPNSVALGTDTTGNYMSDLTQGTGVTITHTPGEGSNATIAINTAVIQERVANVTDTEIGYLDGVTSAIQTQIDSKQPTFTGYDYEIHVSQVDGNNTTGNGDILKPVASITKALTLITGERRTIVIHPGTYSESPSITTQYTVLTTYEPLGGNTAISGTVSTSVGCTIAGLTMTNLTITAGTGVGVPNIVNSTITGTLTKSGSAAFTDIHNCDIGTAANITGSGLVTINDGNPNFVTVNNASANVIIKNSMSCVAPTVTAGTLNITDSIVIAASTNAVTSSASSVITLANSQFLTPNLSGVAPVVLNGFYSILNCVYDKPSSTLVATSGTGGSTNSIDYFQYINADKFITQGGTSTQVVKGDGSLDSVALGTDTTGNYMSDLTQGTGVSITHTPGEGSNATIAIGQAVGTSSSVQFAAVTAPLIGNASTATTLQNPRTISLGGDVSGSVSFNGSSDVTITATVQPNAVSLGSDTTGDYVSSLVAGTGVTLTNNSGETATPTVAIGQDVATSASVTFASVNAPVSGNATTASTLQNSRTISLSGDVSGSVSFNGSSNVDIATTVQPNSVALGTDTTGNYVNDLTAGTGVTVTHTPGEGSSPTVAIGQSVATSASVTFAHLVVQGDMEVQGTITRLNETNLDIDEAFIYLNANSASANPDMGVAFNYNDGTYRHAGLFRDASDGIFKVFEGYEPEPQTPINTSDATYSDARFQADSIILTQTTGTAPMSVSSSTVVTNLNADKLDGQDGSYYAPIDSPTFTGTVSLPNNTVALGTQTTGNYVNDLTAGTGVTVTHTPGEGSSPTVAIGQAVGTSASVTFAHVSAPVTGNVTGNVTGSSGSTTGNAATATTLQNTRTISLSGDVSGSVSFDGSSNVDITATIQPNSIGLGTDTTGDFVSSLVAGTGVTLTNNSGESATPTIAIGQAVGTSSSVQFASVTAPLIGNVTGNADTATSLATSRTIELTGDVTGSVSFNGSANASIAATIQPNSVSLGTDTTGNYVNDLTGGTGVTITHTPGEGSSPTVAIGQSVATSASVTFASVTAPLIGNVTGDVTGSSGSTTGNAATATALQSARSISLTGDVSGSVSFNGTSDVSISATIQPNSVALGTDTTGNYVNDLTAGTGVTVTHTPGEGTSPTVAIGQAVGTSSSVTFAAVTAPLVGNASTATALQTARNIAGQSFDGSANISIAPTDLTGVTSTAAEINILDGATLSTTELNYVDGVTSAIQTQIDTKAPSASPTFTGVVTLPDNTVALGIKTTGDYVSSLVAGTGVTLTNNSGETATPTIAIGQSVATSASVTFEKVDTTGDVTVGGNLTVNGTTTTLNTETLAIEDNIVVLNSNVTGSPTTNAGIEVERGTSSNVSVRWNETSDKWELTQDGSTYLQIATASDVSAVTIASLDDIGDVSASTAAAGDFLKWNGAAWVNDPINLGTDTTGNYLLDVVAGTGLTVSHTPGEGSSASVALNATLDDLSNVNVSAPTDGYFLKYVSASSAWVPAEAVAAPTTTSVSASTSVVVDSFNKTTHRSAEFTIQVTQGSLYTSLKALVLHDGTTSKLVQYGIITFGETPIPLTVSSDISGSNVRLSVTITDAAATSATVKVIKNTIAI